MKIFEHIHHQRSPVSCGPLSTSITIHHKISLHTEYQPTMSNKKRTSQQGLISQNKEKSDSFDSIDSPSTKKDKIQPAIKTKINRRDTKFHLATLGDKGMSHTHSMAAINQEKEDIITRSRVVKLICIMQLFANFDAGVIPATLEQIMTEYQMTSAEAGLLGSLVYVGLVFSCPLTGYLLTTMKSQRKILIGSLFLNLVALALFGFCPPGWKYMLMFTRFLTGLSQAPLFVFPPVWVDEFAPEDSVTIWTALLQAMVPLGITSGFVGAIIFNSISKAIYGDAQYGWRYAIWFQILILAPFLFIFTYLRGRYFNVLGGKEARLHDQAIKIARASDELKRASLEVGRKEAIANGARASSFPLENEEEEEDEDYLDIMETVPLGTQLCLILKRPVFLWIVLGLSGLYFVVTGIQFWTVSYMQDVIGADLMDIQIAFAITSITGPLIGVLFGGWLVDKMGGYKADASATANTLITCNFFGVGAVICAVFAAFATNFIWSVTLIWLILFFGGALLPALTGCCLNSIPEDCRAVASSFSMFTYNILGYALAPVLMGSIADSYIDVTDLQCSNYTEGAVKCASRIVGATAGFQFGMFTSAVAVLACIGATLSQLRLASSGARPAFLAFIPYSDPDRVGLTDDVESESTRYVCKWGSFCSFVSILS